MSSRRRSSSSSGGPRGRSPPRLPSPGNAPNKLQVRFNRLARSQPRAHSEDIDRAEKHRLALNDWRKVAPHIRRRANELSADIDDFDRVLQRYWEERDGGASTRWRLWRESQLDDRLADLLEKRATLQFYNRTFQQRADLLTHDSMHLSMRWSNGHGKPYIDGPAEAASIQRTVNDVGRRVNVISESIRKRDERAPPE